MHGSTRIDSRCGVLHTLTMDFLVDLLIPYIATRIKQAGETWPIVLTIQNPI